MSGSSSAVEHLEERIRAICSALERLEARVDRMQSSLPATDRLISDIHARFEQHDATTDIVRNLVARTDQLVGRVLDHMEAFETESR